LETQGIGDAKNWRRKALEAQGIGGAKYCVSTVFPIRQIAGIARCKIVRFIFIGI